MESRNRPFLIVLIIFLIAFFMIRFLLSQGELKYDWYEWQALESEEPYGYSLFIDLLEDATEDQIIYGTSSLIDSLPLTADSLTYFYMGFEFNGSEAEIDHLVNFVSEGNDAFICVDNLFAFHDALGLDYDFVVREYWDSSRNVNMNFTEENLRTDSGYNYQFFHADTVTIGHWNFFDMDTYSDSMMVYDFADPIATIENAVNFSSFPIGKGKLYVHVEQRLFSNIHLKETEGLEYANKVLSQFDVDHIYFDRYNEVFHDENENENTASTPLGFIFDHDSLRYGWYVLLFSIFIFLLFRSKRQQRIIPIVPSVDNTSIEFAKALGTLYYQSNSPKYLCSEMMRLFHTFNRRRYNLQPGKKGESNAESLSKKSRVNPDDINKIYDLERRLRYNDMARMNEVTPLFEALKNYYKTAK